MKTNKNSQIRDQRSEIRDLPQSGTGGKNCSDRRRRRRTADEDQSEEVYKERKKLQLLQTQHNIKYESIRHWK